MLKYLLVALAFANFFIIKIIQKVLGAGSAEKLVMATVVTFALCEAVALFGLVLFLLKGNAMDFYTFMFLSLFYFWLFFPKYPDWEAKLGRPVIKKFNEAGFRNLNNPCNRSAFITTPPSAARAT